MTEEAIETGRNDTNPGEGTQSDDANLNQQVADEAAAGADQNADGAEASEQEGNQAAEVPDTYEFNMPDGLELDAGLAEAASPVFKELGLSQDQADKLTGLMAEHQQQQAQAQADAFTQQLDSWATEIKNDAEIGGEAFEKNAAVARQAIEKLGSPELNEMLAGTGIGNHPAMFKFALAVGKLLAEDQPGSGDRAGSNGSAESRLYPNEAR